MPNTAHNPLQVAVGVVKSAEGKFLCALREPNVHQGGLWEFPGGKLEPGETAEQALVRELHEELHISVISATPLISIKHHYPDLCVQLHVFLVTEFTGSVRSASGQPCQWLDVAQLNQYAFPKANQPIINALSLPDRYAILDDGDALPLLPKLQKILAKDVKLIQARLKHASVSEVEVFLQQAQPLLDQHQAKMLINSAVAGTFDCNAAGIHLTSRDLMALSQKPEVKHWLAASCHNLQELQKAEQLGVDFVVVAPVQATTSHPDQPSLGWPRFAELVAQTCLPVFALGGMINTDLAMAKQMGAQGIAGISTFLTD